MMQVDIASMTSKGQFTILKRFREILGVRAGSKFIVVCDGEHLLLKPIKPRDTKAFHKVMDEAKRLERRAKKKR